MKKMILLTLLALSLSACGSSQNNQVQTKNAASSTNGSLTLFAMDTVITIEAYGENADQAAEQSGELIERMESLWSVTDEGSEIYQANHSGGSPTELSEETGRLLAFALETAAATEGAFDPTIYPVLRSWGFTTSEYQIPDQQELASLLRNVDYRAVQLNGSSLMLPAGMEIDLGGIAKGFAGDSLKEQLISQGVTSAFINLGGNVSLIGNSPRGDRWKIGIRSPYGDGNVGVLEAADENIITSGIYERNFTGTDGVTYGHILNPADGRPVDNELLSVTIVGAEGRLCDALSTAMFVKGLAGAIDYWQEHRNFEMILITKSDELYVTEPLSERFQMTEIGAGLQAHIIGGNAKAE